MTSTFASRFRPLTDPAAASIYETIREHDEDSSASDVEERAGLLPDSPIALSPASHPQTAAGRPQQTFPPPRTNAKHNKRRPFRQSAARSALANLEEPEDDVPASLLIEGPGQESPQQRRQLHNLPPPPSPPQLPAWNSDEYESPALGRASTNNHRRLNLLENAKATSGPAQRALWRWANVENLDNFLADVYDYYISKGFWSIILQRTLNILTLVFVIGFCLFLTQCINYSSIRGSSRLDDILVRRCTARMGFVPNLVLWLTTFVCISKVFQHLMDIQRLRHLHDFYHHLLHIPETEIQSISWQEVVSRLMALRDDNPNIKPSGIQKTKRFATTQSKQRMDAHDIANRLMRKDNYMIALVNKDILDTSLPIPFFGRVQFFTKGLEWHINYCIMDFVFNHQGQLRQLFLKDTHRKALSEALRRRFIFAGTTSLLVAPFLVTYNLVQNFFQHFNEYQKDPAQIGSRQYTVFAQWKFREFNELNHLFDRRLKMSHPFATRYINQFPKAKTVQAARFVTFVSGAIVSILGLATILDQENFLSFEITPGRTTIFYLGVFGSIWAVARGMLPDDNMVYDSSYSMEEVIEFTHYRPAQWDGRLHTVDVKSEFELLYQMQILVLLKEILGMVFIPFVLCFSLPLCSERIIDFFREFTVHVDGLGYVCSYAEFNLKKYGQTAAAENAGSRAQGPATLAALAREEYYAPRDNKMEQSFRFFMNDYKSNPKSDVRFPYHSLSRHQKQMIPPPKFPTLLSPTLQSRNPAMRDAMHDSGPRTLARRPGKLNNAEGAIQASQFQSLVLDPHHLPQHDDSDFIREETLQEALEENQPQIHQDKHEHSKRMPNEELRQGDQPELGHSEGGALGSWNRGVESESGSETEDDIIALTGEAGGVLGLIRQFQKVQGNEKRGGVPG